MNAWFSYLFQKAMTADVAQLKNENRLLKLIVEEFTISQTTQNFDVKQGK